MRIQHNIAALNSYRNLTTNNNAVSKNLEKLSSGYRINRAGDDAAGLAISEKMRAQITGLETAQKNANDGISLIQTAEGALTEVHSMLNRMVELADQSANGTYQDEVDRENLQKEMNSLSEEINRISKSSNFNGINLLDGSLSNHPGATVENSYISSTAGVTLNQGANGAGSNGEFTIDLSAAFGTGDTIQLEGLDADGGAITQTFTFGTDFTGGTVEEQAQSLADKLNTTAAFSGNFNISVDGSKVILTSKSEGAAATAGNAGSAIINKVTTVDQTATLGAPSNTTAVAGTAYKGGFNALIGTGTTGTGAGINIEAGNVLEFEFQDGAGNSLKAYVEVTQDMIDANPSQSGLTQAIADKLNNTKFADVAGTAADESTLKVSDLFTVTANKNSDGTTAENGAIAIEGKAGVIATATGVTVYSDSTKTTTRGSVSQAGTAAGTGDAQKTQIAKGTNNFTAGDRISIGGVLSDGKSFTLELEAGKDFEIDATSYDNTMQNLVDAINDGSVNAVIDGGRTVASDEIFGANKEFTISDATGKVTIESNNATTVGKGQSGSINTFLLNPADAAETAFTKKDAIPQDFASSSVDISKDIGYGAAIKVGDTTFEVVADARDVTSRNNVAVVISDLQNKTTADIAKAISDAAANAAGFTTDAKMDADGDGDGTVSDAERTAAKEAGAKYSVSVSGNTITFTTLEKGSSIEAPKLSAPYGDKTPVKDVTFDPKKLSYGDSFSLEGKDYQFVKDIKDVEAGKIGVIVDLSTANTKDVADAIADVAQGVKATVSDDGTITFQALAGADGKVAAPKFTFESKGLSLQVGDTAEDHQKVNVKVGAMNTETLGLDSVNISTQSNASNAIDVIKNAINMVSSTRGDLGAVQNRLEHTINNLSVTSENMTAAESRIRDVDMAKEMMAYTKNNILVQASQSMLAQANQVPQGVLQLLQ